tara:strand:- start:2461 stop:3033 length:573 start_codon:yes stop_codon:yes gene_type:complete
MINNIKFYSKWYAILLCFITIIISLYIILKINQNFLDNIILYSIIIGAFFTLITFLFDIKHFYRIAHSLEALFSFVLPFVTNNLYILSLVAFNIINIFISRRVLKYITGTSCLFKMFKPKSNHKNILLKIIIFMSNTLGINIWLVLFPLIIAFIILKFVYLLYNEQLHTTFLKKIEGITKSSEGTSMVEK